MPRVVLAAEARRDLDDLIRTHSLPADTPQRVRRSLAILRDFPLVGASLRGRWRNYRFLLGPWRWMVIVYRFDEDGDTAIVMRIYDGRTSSSPTGG